MTRFDGLAENGGLTDSAGPAENGGLADDTGPAENSGLADDTGPAENSGLSDDAGPTENSGLADGAGPAENGGLADDTGPAENSGLADDTGPAESCGPGEVSSPAAMEDAEIDSEDPSASEQCSSDEEPSVWEGEWERHFPDWRTAPDDGAVFAEESVQSPEEVQEEISLPQGSSADREPPKGGWRIRSGLTGFFAGLAAALLLTALVRFVGQAYRNQNRYPSQYDSPDQWSEIAAVSIPQWPVGQGAELAVTMEHGDSMKAKEVYRTVNPSVVTVLVGLSDKATAVGTGVIFTDDGYLLTNYHVIEGGQQCMAVTDIGQTYPALYVAGDAASDLAVLKMDCQDPLPAAVFGDSDRLSVGDDVYAIGNPLGVDLRGTMTNGIISATSRSMAVDGHVMTLIQTNAALNSGNSGGPLIDEYGQVVGINVVKMRSSRIPVEGLGFAIPSAVMDRIVNDLLTYGEILPEPVLGVSVDQSPTELADGILGIRVGQVTPGSAADEAGVREGDYILSAGGTDIHSSQDLLRVRRRLHAGDKVTVTLWRDGESIETVLLLRETEGTA